MKDLSPGGWIRLAAIGGCVLLLLPLQLLLRAGPPRHAGAVPRLFHRLTCRILGVRRHVRGVPPPAGRGGLIVASHVSWLDIPVLGAMRPLSFVAKAEVAGWPVVGLLARLQRTLFIDRTRKGATAPMTARMGERLALGESIVLFAEGTTGDGTRILPLRSALIGAAQEALGAGAEAVTLYPLTITYTGFHGLAGGRVERSALAWYGDTELGPHLKAMLSAGAIDVELAWAEPIVMTGALSRKEAARRAEGAIRAGRNEALRSEPSR